MSQPDPRFDPENAKPNRPFAKKKVAAKMPFRKVKGTDFKTLTGDKGSRDLAKFLTRFKSSPAGKKAKSDKAAWDSRFKERLATTDLWGNKKK